MVSKILKMLGIKADDKKIQTDFKRDDQDMIVANRRGKDGKPNEPYDIETDPIRFKKQDKPAK